MERVGTRDSIPLAPLASPNVCPPPLLVIASLAANGSRFAHSNEMTMMDRTLRILWSIFILLISLEALGRSAEVQDGASLSEMSAEERKQRIRDELVALRQQHESVMFRSGAVYQPENLRGSDEHITFDFDDVPVGRVAQLYATVSQKEIMVSQKVAWRPMSLAVSNSDRRSAVVRIENALKEVGVRITPIGDTTVALTDVDA